MGLDRALCLNFWYELGPSFVFQLLVWAIPCMGLFHIPISPPPLFFLEEAVKTWKKSQSFCSLFPFISVLCFFLGKLFFFNLPNSFSQKKKKNSIIFLLNLIKGKKFIIHSSTTSLSTAAWKCQVHQASSQLWNSMSRYIYCRSSRNSANWIWSANSHFILHRLRLFLKCPWSWSP